jgi:hypothetical protein
VIRALSESKGVLITPLHFSFSIFPWQESHKPSTDFEAQYSAPHCAIEFYDSIWPPVRIDNEFRGLESVSDALRYIQGSQHVARSLSCCRCFLAYVRASEIFDGEDMSSEKIRVGIMGAGGWAKYSPASRQRATMSSNNCSNTFDSWNRPCRFFENVE